MSPKKVRLVADAIKGKGVHDALIHLRFMPKIAAQPVVKLLQSAVANAEHNNNLKADDLMIQKIVVNQAAALKRWKPAAFGSAHGFKKHGTHIDLYLTLKPGIAQVETAKKKSTQQQEAAKKDKHAAKKTVEGLKEATAKKHRMKKGSK